MTTESNMTPSPSDTAALVERLKEIRDSGPYDYYKRERDFMRTNLPQIIAALSALAETQARLAEAHTALYAYRAALSEHWLTGIECDHASKTDVATCYCSVWRSQPQPTVGGAVAAWIAHVEERAAFKAPYLTSPPAAAAERGETT